MPFVVLLQVLLKDFLIPKSSDMKDDEATVFYLKMTGDYYRYLAEVASNEGGEDSERMGNLCEIILQNWQIFIAFIVLF